MIDDEIWGMPQADRSGDCSSCGILHSRAGATWARIVVAAACGSCPSCGKRKARVSHKLVARAQNARAHAPQADLFTNQLTRQTHVR
jgi:hypothetical protein